MPPAGGQDAHAARFLPHLLDGFRQRRVVRCDKEGADMATFSAKLTHGRGWRPAQAAARSVRGARTGADQVVSALEPAPGPRRCFS